MKTILFFGDSNTYGLKPDGTGRFDFPVRYPGRVQKILGGEYRIVEEGCPGRTTVFEDKDRPYKKGLDYITPCLQSHGPLDFVAVMLGTNDCKSAFHASGGQIAAGVSEIVARIRSGGTPPEKILVISPAPLGGNIGKPGFDPEFNLLSVTVSESLASEYRLLAEKERCLFLDASAVAQVSPSDQQHLDETGHHNLARAIAKIIAERYSIER